MELFGTHFQLTFGAYRLRVGVSIEERDGDAAAPPPPSAVDVAARIARERRSQEPAK